MKIRLVLSTTALLLGLAAAQSYAQVAYGTTLGDDKYQPSVGQSGKDVIWVPTNDAVADAMLKAANVGPNDLVFELRLQRPKTMAHARLALNITRTWQLSRHATHSVLAFRIR